MRDLAERFEYFASALIQKQRIGGRHEPAGFAMKQRFSETFFDIRHSSADGWLRNTKTEGRSGCLALHHNRANNLNIPHQSPTADPTRSSGHEFSIVHQYYLDYL